MARTRQKSKQRQAKRREKPSVPEQANAAGDAMRTEAAAPADANSPAEVAADEIAPAPVRTRSERAPKPPRPEKAREKRPERARDSRAERKAQPRQRGRVVNFFVQVWAELRRVQWPTRSQVMQATAVVVVFCFLAGSYLAIWDFVFNKLVKTLL